MSKSCVYYSNSLIGEVEIYPKNSNPGTSLREIRISHLSPPSERCPPLAVLHTIGSGGVRFKMESKTSEKSPLLSLHAACLRDNKTAVVPLGEEEELHLVAMISRKSIQNYVCFWGFNVALAVYNDCLSMLNLRTLGIVFDLDETLIHANTLRSFETKIANLQQQISNERDPQRSAGILDEIKQHEDDRSILKQYAENDQVVENGYVYRVQPEIVAPLSERHQEFIRPIIRLQEKNIVLTRIDPSIRDTSVLVRLRPGWEDLRRYLIARGRRRFEVYVCTKSERPYAFEMWRLLDPDSSLINYKQVIDRVVCAETGNKSLQSVFRGGTCHPKMALVIDDRLEVWDEKDQPHVHVVPAFAPYSAPQAEANSNVPVLCVVRNVACSVRGLFFKSFDEELLPRVCKVIYEDENIDFPSAPDVGSYVISEDNTCKSSGNVCPVSFDGLANADVEMRLKEASSGAEIVHSVARNFELRPLPSTQNVMPSSSGAVSIAAAQSLMPLIDSQCPQSVQISRPLDQSDRPETTSQGSPGREEGEVPESELDPNTRRRLLILHHGQDTRDCTPFPVRPPLHLSVPPDPTQQQRNSIHLEEQMNLRQLNKTTDVFSLEPQTLRHYKKQPHPLSREEKAITFGRFSYQQQRLDTQLHQGDDLHQDHAASNCSSFPGIEMPARWTSSSQRDFHLEAGSTLPHNAENSVGILRNIAMKCGSEVKFRTIRHDTTDHQFCTEVWFAGEKIGEGIGRTRKETHRKAAEVSLQNLSKKYSSIMPSNRNTLEGDLLKPAYIKENGFITDLNSAAYKESLRKDFLPAASISGEACFMGHKTDISRKSKASYSALKELCTVEGYNPVFQAQPSPLHYTVDREVFPQSLVALKPMVGQFTRKRSGSQRSSRAIPNKRIKPNFSWVPQKILYSGRHFENRTPVR